MISKKVKTIKIVVLTLVLIKQYEIPYSFTKGRIRRRSNKEYFRTTPYYDDPKWISHYSKNN